MKVEAIMTKDAATCSPEDGVDVAARIMRDRDCGIVPVVSRGRAVVGVITDRDVCLAALASGKPLAEMRASSAMTSSVRSCRADADVAEALEIMRAGRVRRLPVVDGTRLVGIVSIDDVALAAVRAEAEGLLRGHLDEVELARTVAAVCRRRVVAST